MIARAARLPSSTASTTSAAAADDVATREDSLDRRGLGLRFTFNNPRGVNFADGICSLNC